MVYHYILHSCDVITLYTGVIAVVSLMVGSVLDTRLGDSSTGPSDPSYSANKSDITVNVNVTEAPYNVTHGTPTTSWNGMDNITIQKVQLAAALSFVSGFIMVGLSIDTQVLNFKIVVISRDNDWFSFQK